MIDGSQFSGEDVVVAMSIVDISWSILIQTVSTGLGLFKSRTKMRFFFKYFFLVYPSARWNLNKILKIFISQFQCKLHEAVYCASQLK